MPDAAFCRDCGSPIWWVTLPKIRASVPDEWLRLDRDQSNRRPIDRISPESQARLGFANHIATCSKQREATA